MANSYSITSRFLKRMELETYQLNDDFELPPCVCGVFCFFWDDWPALLVLKQEQYEFVDVDR